jgi:hypothetical protein
MLNENFEKRKKQLAYVVRVAIGYRSIEEFARLLKVVNTDPIIKILKKDYKEFPDTEYERINNYVCEAI